MLSDAEGYVGTDKAYLLYFPGLMILLTVLCVNFLGDGLRDAFDPQRDEALSDDDRLPPTTSSSTIGPSGTPSPSTTEAGSRRCSSVRDLTVEFPTDDGVVHAVDGVSLRRRRRTRRSASSGSRARARASRRWRSSGCCRSRRRSPATIQFRGASCSALSEKELREAARRRDRDGLPGRARRAEPGVHGRRPDRARRSRSTTTMSTRRAARPRASSCSTSSASRARSERVDQYPHEYSGGMRQRAMIAMAIANDPDLLIADEPTTALDVTIQAQVLEVLERIQDRTQSSIILITHDLGVVAGVADRVHGDVRRPAGRARHRRRDLLRARAIRTPRGCWRRCRGSTGARRDEPAPPHRGSAAVADPRCRPGARSTRAARTPTCPGVCTTERPELRAGRRRDHCVGVPLRRATLGRAVTRVTPRRPSATSVASRPSAEPPVLEVDGPGQGLPDPRRAVPAHRSATVQAVSGVTLLGATQGETLGLVGESGCGKSTTGRLRAAAARGRRRARCSSTAQTCSSVERRRPARAAPQDADRVPGPVRVARTRG